MKELIDVIYKTKGIIVKTILVRDHIKDYFENTHTDSNKKCTENEILILEQIKSKINKKN